MARKRVVSRTIKTVDVKVKAYDPGADEIFEEVLLLTGVTKDCCEERLKKMCTDVLENKYVGVTPSVLKATVVYEKTTKYVMDEQEFVQYAEEVDCDQKTNENEEGE